MLFSIYEQHRWANTNYMSLACWIQQQMSLLPRRSKTNPGWTPSWSSPPTMVSFSVLTRACSPKIFSGSRVKGELWVMAAGTIFVCPKLDYQLPFEGGEWEREEAWRKFTARACRRTRGRSGAGVRLWTHDILLYDNLYIVHFCIILLYKLSEYTTTFAAF